MCSKLFSKFLFQVSLLFQDQTDSKMVNNANAREPVLVEISNIDLTNIQQRAQFEDPNQVVWDLCWDSERETVVILCGSTNQHRMVDCDGCNKQGRQLTLRDVMRLIGYNLNTFRLANVWTGDNTDVQELSNCTIENLPLSQFEVM
jgi:hypothetical protein